MQDDRWHQLCEMAEELDHLIGLVWFYGISTIAGYLMPNPFYTYISNMYDLAWFSFMVYQPLQVI